MPHSFPARRSSYLKRSAFAADGGQGACRNEYQHTKPRNHGRFHFWQRRAERYSGAGPQGRPALHETRGSNAMNKVLGVLAGLIGVALIAFGFSAIAPTTAVTDMTALMPKGTRKSLGRGKKGLE